MPTPFIMPKFDMDQENATIVEWLKNEGDHVDLDESVLTVETDKVAIEVPSPASGKLARISFGPGDVVPVTTVIAYILAEDETVNDLPEDDSTSEKSTLTEQGYAVQDQVAVGETAVEKVVSATPLASRMAQSLGVDLSVVPSAKNRVTKEDVESYIRSKTAEDGRVAIPATPAARRLARELNVDLAIVTGSGPNGRVQADDVKAFEQTPIAKEIHATEMVPLAGIRKTIAERMQASFQEAPHIALTVEVDISQLESVRQRMIEIAAQGGEDRVSLTALLVKIAAWALNRNPYLNATLDGDTIHLLDEINVGVATAIEDGLIVPVIRDAITKSVREINGDLKDLSQRARQGKLTLDEVKGGTFTISNLGMFGINQFRAIINPPESAILAVGNVVRKPIVINEQDEVAVRPMMMMTLSADHRVIDGVTAARFLYDLVRAVEMPDLLLY
ncbi:MAG: 2-oxo acid dehydrogenase subunit E2 [Chloroflexota bacterium]|nr:MAG: 2-oxo acid dehydrogenase subunit E2 [Chloroflexota bacterium]